MTFPDAELRLLIDAYLPEDDATALAALLAVGTQDYDPHRNSGDFARDFYHTFGGHQLTIGPIPGPVITTCNAALDVLDLHDRDAPHAQVTLAARWGGHTVGGSTTTWALLRAAVLSKFLSTLQAATTGAMDDTAWRSALSGLRYAACADLARFVKAKRQLGLSDPHGPIKLAADLLTVRTRERHHLGSETAARVEAVTAHSDIADMRWKLRSHGYTVSDETPRNLVAVAINMLNAALRKYADRGVPIQIIAATADAEKVQAILNGDLSDVSLPARAIQFEVPPGKTCIVDTAEPA